MKMPLLVVAAALGAATVSASVPEAVDPAAIPAYRVLHRVSPPPGSLRRRLSRGSRRWVSGQS